MLGNGSAAWRRSGKSKPKVSVLNECSQCCEPWLNYRKKANAHNIGGIKSTNVQLSRNSALLPNCLLAEGFIVLSVLEV